jgi:hypothetical protein
VETFEAAMANLVRWLSDDGLVVIDLLEGNEWHHFELPGRGNFIRSYTRSEVEEIFDGDQIGARQDAGHDRMGARGGRLRASVSSTRVRSSVMERSSAFMPPPLVRRQVAR